MQHFAQQTFDHCQRQFFAGEGGEGGDADQGAFQAADVGANAVGEESDDFLRQLDAHGLFLLAQNGHARFDIGRLHFRDQAPFEAGDKALLQVLDFGGGTVAGQDDLFMALVQGVEGVEELLLNPFLAGQKLHVVDEQDIRPGDVCGGSGPTDCFEWRQCIRW